MDTTRTPLPGNIAGLFFAHISRQNMHI